MVFPDYHRAKMAWHLQETLVQHVAVCDHAVPESNQSRSWCLRPQLAAWLGQIICTPNLLAALPSACQHALQQLTLRLYQEET